MTLNELKKIVDLYVSHNHGEDKVVIDLDQVSIGGGAYSEIEQIYEGIDWQKGTIRLAPKKSLIEKTKDRDIPIPIKKCPTFAKSYMCNACGGFVCKKDNYCKNCGQKLGEI